MVAEMKKKCETLGKKIQVKKSRMQFKKTWARESEIVSMQEWKS